MLPSAKHISTYLYLVSSTGEWLNLQVYTNILFFYTSVGSICMLVIGVAAELNLSDSHYMITSVIPACYHCGHI